MSDVHGAAVARRVYIISDLHLGGVYGAAGAAHSRGFRICTKVEALAAFVNGLAGSPADGPRIELVINGDMVDFLAEQNDTPPHFAAFNDNPEAACAKLRAIAERDQPFFKALTNLLDHKHRLTILLGNHDIELALPPVRQALREALGVEGHHDFELIVNGEAYIAGEALIEHGNRYDAWNVVNFDHLRQVSSFLSRHQPVPEKYKFDPPAGSKMVERVINPIKKDYKFIDLLKPETDVALPMVLALEPGYRAVLATVANLAHQASKNQMEDDDTATSAIGGNIASLGGARTTPIGGNMGGIQRAVPAAAPASVAAASDNAALEAALQKRLGGDSAEFSQALAQSGGGAPGGRGASAIAGGASPIGGDISAGNFVSRSMGLAELLFARDNQDVGARLPALLAALRALQPDQSFNRGVETAPEYEQAARARLRNGFRYVIFGHTHLAKKIELQPGCFYFNSGTWADLMQLPPEIIQGDKAAALAALQKMAQSLSTGLIDDLIQSTSRPTYVQLDLDANEHIVAAELCDYTAASAAAP